VTGTYVPVITCAATTPLKATDGRAAPGGGGAGSEAGVDRAIRYRRGFILLALPFVILVAVGTARALIGPGWGLLPLLAVGPAVAATIGGQRDTRAAGAVLLDLNVRPGADYRPAQVAFLAAAAVTAAAVLASRARERRERELAQVRVVADSVQQVLLRPVPRQVGPVRLAVRYLSASSGARVGGDLYEVAATPRGVRLIVGARACPPSSRPPRSSASSARPPTTRTAWPRSPPGSRPAWPASSATSSS
jgi:hypothetical protein